MKLLRRTLLLSLSACALAYTIDLTGGICQIAMGMPHRLELFTSQPEGRLVGSRIMNDPSSQFPEPPQPPGATEELPIPPHGEQNRKISLPQRARKFQSLVERHSEKFRISSCLIYAVIQAESSFNAHAASSASAYGLMQLVPESGGRAAYRLVYGSDEIPSREYLEDPDKNIELGVAYLRLVADFFAEVEDPVSREYCQIAAYNTGAGNVLKAFGSGYAQAMTVINSYSPAEVYAQLTTNLPYEETRNYLPKVLAYRLEFASL